MEEWEGCVVEESLVDNRFLNELQVIGLDITDDEDPAERWHLVKVFASEADIERLSHQLKPTKWYAHFWQDDEVIVVFKDTLFRLVYSKKETWKEAIAHGLSIGIPLEQLDFEIS